MAYICCGDKGYTTEYGGEFIRDVKPTQKSLIYKLYKIFYF